ncbi:Phox homologous domain-containing protein [Coemansia spiralis]|nr:Phox homologous domain-containing protein [Coemansia spiralis]
MEQIRYVKIPTTETRTEPDTHTEYGLQVQGPVRSWTVWRRYNEFLTLANDLSREFPGVETPVPLPPKSLTSCNVGQLEFVEERRRALERYIQSMIMSEDDRWRTSKTLQKFLAPGTKGANWITPASWLNDQRDAEQLARDVRQSIVRRENALTRNEVSVSHQCLLQAKRQLTELGRTLKTLEQGLEMIKSSLTSGELLRRQDMLMRMNEEKGNLNRIVLGTGLVSGSSDRTTLLSAAASRQAPRSRRIFGNSSLPQETNETRGLDDQGLLQMQNQRMEEQDQLAAELSAHLRRQREMGLAIGNELDIHNQLLGELEQDLDRTGNKLTAARRQANRL